MRKLLIILILASTCFSGTRLQRGMRGSGGTQAGETTYALTVNSGSGSGSYASGTVVNIVASAPESGYAFDSWTGATVASASSSSTTITMPAGNTTVTATYSSLTVGYHPAIFLTSDHLTTLNARQAANTTAWSALESWCDTHLNQVNDNNSIPYTAGNVNWNGYRMDGYSHYIINYALAYQLLKDDNPVKAATYANYAKNLLMAIPNNFSSGDEAGNGLIALRCGEQNDRTINSAESTALGIDSAGYKLGYSARNLIAVPLAYDWLYDVLDSSQKTTLRTMLYRWFDWIRGKRTVYNNGVLKGAIRYYEDQDGDCTGNNNCTSLTGIEVGYDFTNNVDNFYSGFFELMSFIPLATYGDSSDMNTYLSYASDQIQSFLLLAESNVANSGGDSVEGWNYGSGWWRDLEALYGWKMATGNDVLSGKTWPQDLLKAMIHRLAPDKLHVPQYGDWTGTPMGENRESTAVVFAGINQLLYPSDEVSKVGQWVLDNAPWDPAGKADEWEEMLWRDSSFPEAPISNMPLSYQAVGNGFISMRSGWGSSDIMAYTRLEGKVTVSHEGTDEGDFQLFRGSDHLITHKVFSGGSIDASTVVFNQSDHQSMNPVQTTPAVDRIEDTTNYFYVSGDITNAWKRQWHPDGAELFRRSILFLRPNVFVINDVTQSNTDLGSRKDWYLQLAGPSSITGNTVSAVVGSSKIYSTMLAPSGGSYTQDQPSNGSWWPIYRVGYHPTDAEYTQFLNVIEATASGSSQTSTSLISGTGGQGALIGGATVVMFTSSQTAADITSLSYSITSTGTTTHYVANATPNHLYTLTGANQANATASSGGILSFTSTGTGSLQTISTEY